MFLIIQQFCFQLSDVESDDAIAEVVVESEVFKCGISTDLKVTHKCVYANLDVSNAQLTNQIAELQVVYLP